MLKSQFDQALRLFNQHDYAAVVAACKPHVQHPMFKLLLATTYGKLAEYTLSEPLFLALRQQYPTNLDVLFNFALVLKLQQRMAEAQALLQQCLTLNNRYHAAHCALAGIYATQGNFEKAQVYYAQALALQPYNVEYLFGTAQCDFGQARYHSAHKKLTLALAQGVHLPSLRLLSVVLYKLKSTQAMRQLRQQHAEHIKLEPEILLYAGLIELDEKCYVQALNLLEKAQVLANKAWFEIDANLLYCRYLLDADKQILQQIISLSQQVATVEAFYFSANLLETLGQLLQAEQLLDIALPLFPLTPSLLLVKAKVLTRRREFNEALAILDEISKPEGTEMQLDICYQKVQIFEAQARYNLAAEQIIHAGSYVQQVSVLDGLEQDAKRAVQDIQQGVPLRGTHVRKLVFIIGFPRSGTTLLESRLALINNVKILEETHAVKQFYQQLERQANGQNVMAYLANLSAEQQNLLAQDYLDSLQDYSVINDDDVIVDKMPLNAIYLAPVLALFPQAKIILMLRHPMDVCISSLKQRMINLFSVESFAQSYHCYFNLLATVQQQFADKVLAVKYEQLVTDYEQEFSAILAHCGLQQEAKTGSGNSPTMFNTPSYHQVSQPLYTKAVNSYQHYRLYFDFQHQLLQTWCRQLGYTASD